MMPAALSQAMLHNATAPINKLPPEICSEILLVLRSDFESTPIFTTAIDDVRPRPFLPTISSQNWLPVAQVCKRWWDLACGDSRLWRAIDVRENLDWLELCLSRSGNFARIEVNFHYVSRVLEGLPVIAPFKDRITKLFLRGVPGEGAPSVITFFNQCLPNLKELALDRDREHSEETVLGSLNSSEVPQLAHLVLSGLPVTWALEVSSRLVSLTIQWTVQTMECHVDLDSFLSLLEAAKSLRNLRLHEALWHGAQNMSPTLDRMISMPELQILEVFDIPFNVYALLRCLRLPLEVAIGLHNTEPFDELFDESPPTFLYLLPEDWCNIEICSSASYARMKDGQIIELIARVEPYTRDYLVMSLLVERDSDASTFVLLLDDFLNLFCDAPLVTIELSGDISQVPKEKWASLFEQFANLRTLKLSCAGSSLTSVCSALSEVSADDNTKAMCPHLHAFEIRKGPEATESEVASIERCLERRKELGADLLERLGLEFKTDKGRVPTLSWEQIVDRLEPYSL